MSLPPVVEAARARAQALLRAGRVPEAIQAYQHLLGIAPGLASSWYNLGYLLQSAARFEDALVAYDRAVSLGIDRVEEVLRNKALVLADHLARPEAAEETLRAALQANSAFVDGWVDLGRIAEQLGKRGEAVTAYERALAVRPDHGLALAKLANVRKVRDPDDPLLDRLRAALADASKSVADRAAIGFALGKALDEVGHYDEAFAAYVQANEFTKASAGHQWQGYHRAGWEAWIKSLPDSIAPADESPCASQAEEPRLIFICGMFRSGSTLAETILSAHPEVTAGGELDVIPRLAQDFWRRAKAGGLQNAPEWFDTARAQYLQAVRSRFPGASVVTDKRPDNFLHLALIKRLFPRAKIVHTRRNPLDNCLSVYFTHFDPSQAYTLDLLDIGHWYRQYEELMVRWKGIYREDILDVQYEDLITDPAAQIARLLQFLDLDWDDACLDFHQAKRSVQTPSVWQVRQPLYATSRGRWRNYSRHLTALAQVLGEAV
jgi:tetratricopeptide (TPR) repeat protein